MTRRQYWVAATLRDDGWVEAAGDAVYDMLGRPDGYERVDPHITVHPGFTIDDADAGKAAGVAASLVGERVRLGPLQYWPSIDEPAVIKLSADVDLSGALAGIEALVEGGGTIDREPVPAHCTLAKAGDAGEEWGSLLRATRGEKAAVAASVPFAETEVSGVRLESRG